MDLLRIDSPYDKQEFTRRCLMNWEINWVKNRRHLINYSIGSLIVLAIGILGKIVDGPTNPFIFLGIGLSALTIFFIYIRIYSNNKYKRDVKEIAEKLESEIMHCYYEFTNDSFKYCDEEKNFEFKWSLFTNYSIFKDYLILILNNSLTNTYLFDKKELDLIDYNRLLEIVESKLEYKKII